MSFALLPEQQRPSFRLLWERGLCKGFDFLSTMSDLRTALQTSNFGQISFLLFLYDFLCHDHCPRVRVSHSSSIAVLVLGLTLRLHADTRGRCRHTFVLHKMSLGRRVRWAIFQPFCRDSNGASAIRFRHILRLILISSALRTHLQECTPPRSHWPYFVPRPCLPRSQVAATNAAHADCGIRTLDKSGSTRSGEDKCWLIRFA